jgi:hypothetical protein
MVMCGVWCVVCGAEKDGHWCRAGRTLVQRRTDIREEKDGHWCREGRTLVQRRTDIGAEKDGHWCREGRTLVQRRTDIGAEKDGHSWREGRTLVQRRTDIGAEKDGECGVWCVAYDVSYLPSRATIPRCMMNMFSQNSPSDMRCSVGA